MPEPCGTVALVLHSHIPYVLGHNQLEEEWLFEAVAESYLPLLSSFRRLISQNTLPRVTLGLTPVLLEQLADPRFAPRFVSYIERKAQAARDDQRTFFSRNEAHLAYLAGLWESFYRHTASFFHTELRADMIGGFRQLQTAGQLELLASAATHAYLPLLGTDASLQAQIVTGTACYRRYFETGPRGYWLPECGYRPAGSWTSPLRTSQADGLPASGAERPVQRQGIDPMLVAAGLQYFIADQPQLMASLPDAARPSPLRVHRVAPEHPSALAESVSMFTRDFETTAQVWQHDGGYPGDPWYLEFHKKHAAGELRYWRITDRQADLGLKQPYVPHAAFGMVRTHAAHFAARLRERLRRHWEQTQEKGIIVAAFDTELFGHWWFEGVQWLTEVIHHIGTSEEISLTSCGAFLPDKLSQRPVQLVESSWGEGGDHRMWLNDTTQAFWRDVHQAEKKMQLLGEAVQAVQDDRSKQSQEMDEQEQRILRQAGRELLLLQSSDWPFMLTRQMTPDHAEQRISLHRTNFQHCVRMAEQYRAGEALSENDWQALEQMERQHPLFQDLDPRLFWSLAELSLPAEKR